MSTQLSSTRCAFTQLSGAAAIGLLLLSLIDRADAREWHVYPDSTGDAPFLQAAIDSASDGDVIHLAAGFHPGGYVLVVEKSLTIYGDGPSTQSPTINFAGNDTDVTADIRDLTVHGSPEGGFSFKHMASALVERCVISDTEFGVNVNSVNEVTVRDCLFQDNHHPAGCGTYPSGGAISIQGGGFDETYLIESCTFIRNSSDNCASGYGAGAIAITASLQNPAEITRCLFVGNSAPTGGAIGLTEGKSNIHHNLFIANDAQDAVIFEDGFAEGRVFGNVFANNDTNAIWSFTFGFMCGCNVYVCHDGTKEVAVTS